MKRFIEDLRIMIIKFVMVVAFVYMILLSENVYAINDAEIVAKINEVDLKLHEKYAVVYWNQGAWGSASDVLFKVKNSACGATCNSNHHNGIQCYGFASALSEYIFGSSFVDSNSWSSDNDITWLRPGDVINVGGGNGHTAVVWTVEYDSNGEIVPKVLECWGPSCIIVSGNFNGGKYHAYNLKEINASWGNSIKIYRNIVNRTDYLEPDIMPSIKVYGLKMPTGTIEKNFGLRGVITANCRNVEIRGGIYDESGKKEIAGFINSYSSSNGYINLQNTLNNSIVFQNLPGGKYTYKVEVRANNGAKAVKVDNTTIVSKFDIPNRGGTAANQASNNSTPAKQDSAATNNTIKETKWISIKDANEPPALMNKGDNFGIRGVVTTNGYDLSVTGGIYYSSDGKAVDGFTFRYANRGNTIDLQKTLNNDVIFNNLDPGRYVYRITAEANGENLCLNPVTKESRFTVIGPSSGSANAAKPAVKNVSDESPVISLSGVNYPSGTLNKGSNFGLRGIVSTSVGNISIEGGVYDLDGNPISGYVKSYAGTGKSINIQNTLNDELIFNTLPAGYYIYKVSARAVNGSQSSDKIVAYSNFEIKDKTVAATAKPASGIDAFVPTPATKTPASTPTVAPVVETPVISASNVNYPSGTLTQGSNFGLRGVISTNVGNISITGGVYYTNGYAVDGMTNTYYGTGTSVDIQYTLNDYVVFNNLPAGDYVYKVTATAVNGSKSSSQEIANSKFTIKDTDTPKQAATSVEETPVISVSNVNYPSGTLTQGSNFGLRGIISTNVGSISITGGVYYTNGYAVDGMTNTYYGSVDSVNIKSTLNDYVVFNNLPAGEYVYKVTATAINGNKSVSKEVANSTFTVKGKDTPKPTATPAPAPTNVDETPVISSSNVNYPSGTLTQGTNFGLRGVISTNVGNISITGGVYYTNGYAVDGMTNTYYGSGDSVNIKSTLNDYVVFNNLPAGDYVYKVTATAINGSKSASKEVVNSTFTVKGIDTPKSTPTPAPTYVEETPVISSSNINYPSGILTQGTNFGLRGIVSTNVGSISITGGVYYTNGYAVDGMTNTYYGSGNSVNIQYTLNDGVIFNNLAAGDYVYKVTATAVNGSKTVSKEIANSTFTIKSKDVPAPYVAPTPAPAPVYDDTPVPSISISGQNYPSYYHRKGNNFGIRGIVSTNCGGLTAVRGYVYDSYGNIVPGFASEYNANWATSFDLRYSINNDLIFNNLAVGSYRYVVTATAVNGTKTTDVTLIDYSFVVQ